jgi:hypothetical protein
VPLFFTICAAPGLACLGFCRSNNQLIGFDTFIKKRRIDAGGPKYPTLLP